MDSSQLIGELRRLTRAETYDLVDVEALLRRVAHQTDGESVLVEALAGARSSWLTGVLLDGLGRARGPLGVDELRRHVRVTGPGSRDIRIAALAGLTRRLGPGATPDLRGMLAHRDGDTRHAAVHLLVDVGDDTAWDDVLDLWSTWLARGERTMAPVVYLLRGAGGSDERRVLLVQSIRRHWDDAGWAVERFWPDAGPDGPGPEATPVPDYSEVARWWIAESGARGDTMAVTDHLEFDVTHVLSGTWPGRVQYLGQVVSGDPTGLDSEARRDVIVDGRHVDTTYVSLSRRRIGDTEYSTLHFPYRDVPVPAGARVTVQPAGTDEGMASR